MTAQIAVWGRLGGDPRPLETKTGKSMAAASVAVDVEQEGEPEWFGIVAFGSQADALAKHGRGECVSVSGRLERRRFTDRNGDERQQMQIIAEHIVSARTVRPGGGKQKRQAASREQEAARELYGGRDETLDDPLPF